jgi:putative flippase GtrA
VIGRLLSADFLRFGLVGASGFIVDAGVVYGLRGVIGVYAAMIVSYLLAASWNWLWNRVWTFGHLTHGAMRHQWGRFLGANTVGLLLNRGAAIGLAACEPWLRLHPIVPLAVGTAVGMGANFILSKRYVFK